MTWAKRNPKGTWLEIQKGTKSKGKRGTTSHFLPHSCHGEAEANNQPSLRHTVAGDWQEHGKQGQLSPPGAGAIRYKGGGRGGGAQAGLLKKIILMAMVMPGLVMNESS